jgi:hypothetical protein
VNNDIADEKRMNNRVNIANDLVTHGEGKELVIVVYHEMQWGFDPITEEESRQVHD